MIGKTEGFRFRILMSLTVSSLLLLSGCAANNKGADVQSRMSTTNSLAATPKSQGGSILNEFSSAVNNVYETISPSVCEITTITQSSQSGSTSEDIGSGFFIDNKGHIATNDHVVGTARTVSVQVGQRTYTGKVIGRDRLDDLALIQVKQIPGMKPLSFGSAKTLKPGYFVIAIGNPFQLVNSVSSGIVSGLNRSMPSVGGREMSDLIQTDATINPGNSGGPMLNAAGKVVGINTMIESPVQGFTGTGFAIPIERLKKVLPDLLNGKTIEYPWLGITGVNVDLGLQQQFNLPTSQGVLVISTVPGGPAAKAGIRGDSGGATNPAGNGDIITAVDGKQVSSVANLTAELAHHSVGSRVDLTLLRHGKQIHLKVVLGKFPTDLSSGTK